MFGGLYPDGTATAGPELLSDLTLEKIDYDWIKNQTKASFLKRAIKIIEEDGNYFPDLKEACTQRLIQIDPSKAPKVFNNNINETEKRKIDQDINSWEQEVTKKEQAKMSNPKIFEMTQENSSSSSSNDYLEDQRKIKAENEKNKGNEALKSKDYKEAIEYYTKSIEYDSKLAASYCNRALVYLKLKEYDKVITDCNIAINLDASYLKAYHRRGKARFAQDKVYEAYCDFKFIMEREPDNKDVNGDLKECQEILKKQNTNPEKGFKRVQIVEEDDGDNDDEEANEDEDKVEMSDYSEVIIQSAKDKARQKHSTELNVIEEKKEKANGLIKNGLFDQAIQLLKQCLSSIESLGSASTDKEDIQEFQKKKANYLNNLALCYKQLDDNHSVINYAQQVIAMKASLSNDVLVKAYLRRGMAYERLEKYKRSLRDFQKVKHLDPGNLQSSQGLRRVQQCVKFDKDVVSASEDDEKTENNGQLVVEEVEEEEMVLVKKTASGDKSSNSQEKKEEAQGKQGKPTGNTNATATTSSSSTSKANPLDTLIKQKEQANALFTNKDTNGALLKFKEIAREIELKYASQLNNLEESVLSLYEQVLSNECLCLLNLQKYTETITCATSALHYRELNIKCLYRRAQALKALADSEETATQAMTLQQLQQSYDKYEKSRKDLEKVVSIDPINKPAKQLLQDVSRKAIEVKLALRKAQSEIEGKQQKEAEDKQGKVQKDGDNDNETDANKNTKQTKGQEAAPITKNLNTQELHELTQQALQTAAENLVKQFKLPESQTEFEREFNSLKSSSGNTDKLYAYIKQIPGEYFAKSIYDKNDIPSNILIAIIKALKEYGTTNGEDKEISQKIVKGLTQTAKFHLCAKFITKKEKQEIKGLLEAIDLAGDSELLQAFKIQA